MLKLLFYFSIQYGVLYGGGFEYHNTYIIEYEEQRRDGREGDSKVEDERKRRGRRKVLRCKLKYHNTYIIEYEEPEKGDGEKSAQEIPSCII